MRESRENDVIRERKLLNYGRKHFVELPAATGTTSIVDGSVPHVDDFFIDWWSYSMNKETICIPPCLDVDKNRFLGPSNYLASNFDPEWFSTKERQWAGQAAEDAFIKAFQRLNIGGILIFGFDTMEFARVRKLQKLFKKRGIGQIECDFIFIHPLLGIFVIELKATKQRIEETSPTYQKAIQLTRKIKEQIPLIYELLTNQKFNVPIYGAVCFPFSKIDHFARNDDIDIIENFLLDPFTLKNIFLEKMSQQTVDEESLAGLKTFAFALADYRSIEFISPVRNALAIYKMIESQSFMKCKTKTIYRENTIFLTKEQLTIKDCTEKHQIISGPPGTGKTMLLLLRALKEAKTKRPGKVRVVGTNKALCIMFQRFFERYNDEIIRFPVVVECISKNIDNEDDLFIDEACLMNPEIVSLLRKRQDATGKTTAIVTGYFWPPQIVSAEDLMRNKLTSYRHFTMETVIRSTISIVDFWRQEFSESFRFHVGHNIIGPPVQRERLTTIDSIFSRLQLHIVQVLNSADPSNLCIITENTKNCDLIKTILSSYNVLCGSLEEQVINSNLVAVAKFTEALSFEWPIVFIVSLDCVDLYESFILIAASRAVAKLIIFERDYVDVQKRIDRQIMSVPHIDMTRLKLSQFYSFTSNANSFDVHFAMIRHNFRPKELRSLEPFSACTKLFDCLKAIANSEKLCRTLLKQPSIRQPITYCQVRGRRATNRFPKFINVVLAEFSEEWKQELGEIIEELVNKLLFANLNSLPTASYFDKIPEVNMNSTWWTAVSNVIGIFLLAYQVPSLPVKSVTSYETGIKTTEDITGMFGPEPGSMCFLCVFLFICLGLFSLLCSKNE